MALFEDKTGIIIACDVKRADELEVLVEQTADVLGVVGYKVGFALGLLHSLPQTTDVIHNICDLPVIYDHQKASTDIPQMGDLFAEVMKESGVDGAILFPQSGPTTQRAFIKALQDAGIVPIGGGDMTHPQFLDNDVAQNNERGYIRADAPAEMYRLSINMGVRHFILPGNKPEKIVHYKKLLLEDCVILSPGHGRQGGVLSEAIKASYPTPYIGIVGSSIYGKPKDEMRGEAQKWAEEALKTWGRMEGGE